MSLESSGIEKVEAYAVSGQVFEDGESVYFGDVVVTWQSSWSGKFYQIYVNGLYAGTTLSSAQRRIVLTVPTGRSAAVIEVFAVDACDAYENFSGESAVSFGTTDRVQLRFNRDQSIGINCRAVVYSGTDGSVDYENSLDDSVRFWPCFQDKAGFGLSRFGDGDFGFDSGAGVGFGRGFFGSGLWGQGADIVEWSSGELCDGDHKFGIKVRDDAGNEGAAFESELLTVVCGSEPAESLSVESYDKESDKLVIRID
jgi:hypothetical protein